MHFVPGHFRRLGFERRRQRQQRECADGTHGDEPEVPFDGFLFFKFHALFRPMLARLLPPEGSLLQLAVRRLEHRFLAKPPLKRLPRPHLARDALHHFRAR